jgi:dihydroorotate dehydrogenase electron transfer subunit
LNQIIAPVITNQEIIPGIYLLWLEASEISTIARPGQYVMLSCGEGTLLRRPLSVHQVDEERLALLFAVMGKGTRWLSERLPGDSVDLLGPLGNGFTIDNNHRRLLLVAGGIGIAPLQFLAQETVKQDFDVTMVSGAKMVSQLYPQKLLPSATCVVATEDGSCGEKGLATDLIPRFNDRVDRIFACGPMAMYRSMAQNALLKGKEVQVSLEARMACGFGVCYGCTVRTVNGLKQVCKDGPVFNLADIIWDELIPR